jgi:TolB-like protein/DNA-binding SARP family transcriptional activator/Flp pilus assembly protein TadD
VYLKVFGGASIEGPSGPLGGRAVHRHRLGLLALLAAHSRITREKVIAYLWPSASETRGRRLLSDSIYRIHAGLRCEAILGAGDDLRLNPDCLACDMVEFRRAMEAGDFHRAAEVYAGPFLDGFFIPDADEFERWASRVRDGLAADHQRALEGLATAAEEAGDAAAAVRWWRQAAATDPLSTRFTVRLMHALARAGDRGAAIRQAQAHSRALQEELGAAPDPEVEELLERIRQEPPRPSGQLLSPAAGRDLGPATRIPPHASDPAARVPVERPVAGKVGSGVFRRRARAVVVVLIVVAMAALAGWLLNGRDPAPGGPRAIAVLPFVDLGPGNGHAYLGEGIAEELIGALGGMDGMRVVGRTSAFTFGGRDVSARQIGRTLDVDAILEGSVRVADGRLRVMARLVDVETGYHLWSETYERPMEDVLRIQDEIVRSIVGTLRGQLTTAPRDGAAVPLVDPEAYNLYLQGRFLWHRRTGPDLRRAVQLMEEAVRRAPDYARAHVGLGDAYAVLGFYDFLPPDDAFPAAKSAALRALELDPTLAGAHATLAYVALYHEWDWPRAEAEFQRAIELAPSYSTAHQWYANFLTAMGRFPEAEAAMRHAQELDPLSLIANAALGWVRYYAGEYELAVAQCQRTLDLDPDFELAHLWLGQALERLGRLDEAEDAVRRAVELGDRSAISRAALARILAHQGRDAEARAILADLVAEDGSRYLPSYEIAQVHAALGDRAGALHWLERAYRERSHSMVFLRVDPGFETLRGDRAFEVLAVRVRLPAG